MGISTLTVSKRERGARLSGFKASGAPTFRVSGVVSGADSFIADELGKKTLSSSIRAASLLSGDYVGQKTFSGQITGSGSWVGDAYDAGYYWKGTEHFVSDGVAYMQVPLVLDSEFEVVSRFKKDSTQTGRRHSVFSAYYPTAQTYTYFPWGGNVWELNINYAGYVRAATQYPYAGATTKQTGFYLRADAGGGNFTAALRHGANSLSSPSATNQIVASTLFKPTCYYSSSVSSAGFRLWELAIYKQALNSGERDAIYNVNAPGDFKTLTATQPNHYWDMSNRYLDGATIMIADIGSDAPGDGSTDLMLVNGSASNFAVGGF